MSPLPPSSSFCIIIITISPSLIKNCSGHSASTCVPSPVNSPDNNSKNHIFSPFRFSPPQTALRHLLCIKVRNVELYYLGHELRRAYRWLWRWQKVLNSLLTSPRPRPCPLLAACVNDWPCPLSSFFFFFFSPSNAPPPRLARRRAADNDSSHPCRATGRGWGVPEQRRRGSGVGVGAVTSPTSSRVPVCFTSLCGTCSRFYWRSQTHQRSTKGHGKAVGGWVGVGDEEEEKSDLLVKVSAAELRQEE